MDPGDELNVPQNGGNHKMPSLDELLKAIDLMDFSEEDKESLRESLLSQGNLQISKYVNAEDEKEIPADLRIMLCLILLVALTFVFFGYKLYKSLSERERRKEEKRRQKQQKKKK